MSHPWMLVALTAVTLAGPARAAEAPPPTDADDQVKTPPPANPGTAKLTDKLAKEFNVPPSEIAQLRSEKLGWGEIAHALAIAQKAGVPVDTVVGLGKSGMGWGQIAQKYGFKLGDVTGKVKEVEREGRKADRDDRGGRHDRDDRGGRHDRDDRAVPRGGEEAGEHGHGGGRR